MTFVVEKNVPIPPKVNRGRYTEGSTHYPWEEMEVNDSFAVPPNLTNRVRVAAGCINTKGQRYFTVRDTPDGHRCWRLR